MKNTVYSVVGGVVAFLLLAITALCTIVASHASLALGWEALSALILGGAVIVGLVCWFFNKIDLIDKAAFAA